MHPSRNLGLAALFASILSACGGGGGGDTAATDNAAVPLASGAGGSSSTSSSTGAPAAAGGGGSAITPAGSGAGAPPPSPAPAPAAAASFSSFDPVLLASNPLPSGAAVARLADGGNVALWVARGATTRDSRLLAQRTDAAGHPVGDVITVHDEVERVSHVSVAAAADGGFLVAWAGYDTVAVTPGSVVVNLMARRYAADGSLQTETRLDPDAQYDVGDIDVQAMPDGGFVAGWSSSFTRTAPLWGYVQRLDAAGGLAGPQATLLDANDGQQQEQIALVPLPDGTVTVAWRNRSVLSPQTFSISTRRFDASLQPITGAAEIAGTTQSTPFLLSAAAAGSHVALAWTVPDGSGNADIRSSVVTAAGANLGPVASVTSAFRVSDLRVEPLGNGNFGVIWQELEEYPRGTNAYVNLQRHDATGAATGAPSELLARGTRWVSDVTGDGVTAGSVLAVDAGADGHVVGEVQIAGQSEPGTSLFGR